MVDINRSHTLLYPRFYHILSKALEDAHAANLMAYIFEGYRFTERQSYLYAQGRSVPGQIVTYARPGQSWHQYGVAVDIVFDKEPLKEGMQWTWEAGYTDDNIDKYSALAIILKTHGLEWLGDARIERAHFQKSWGFTIEQARMIVDAKGVLGLWAEFDKIT